MRSGTGRTRSTYSDLSFGHHDKATGPTTYVFCVEEFVCPGDQILSAWRLETYEHNAVMTSRLKFTAVRRIEVLRDKDSAFALSGLPDICIRTPFEAFFYSGVNIM